MYRIRYRADAGGFVAKWAGLWAGDPHPSRQALEDIRRACPNGEHMEIVEVGS